MSRSRKQPYRKSRAVDSSCRSHGGCPWCEGSRLHKHERRAPLPHSRDDTLEPAEIRLIEHDAAESEKP